MLEFDLILASSCKSFGLSFEHARTENGKSPLLLNRRGGRSQSLRLRLLSCSKIFECGAGSEIFSNLRIRLMFEFRQTFMQPKFSSVCTIHIQWHLQKATKTPAAVKSKKWFRIQAQFFTNFLLRLCVRKKFKILPESTPALRIRCRLRHSGSVVDSGTPDPLPPRLNSKESNSIFDTKQTDRQTFLFTIWENQISTGGEWPQSLRVILPRENTSRTVQKTSHHLQNPIHVSAEMVLT